MKQLLASIIFLILCGNVFANELSQLQFEQAVRYADWKAAKNLLPNISIDKRNKYGENALIIATKEGHAPFVRWLIKKGANFNIKGKYGNIIMHIAASNGHKDVVKVLLESGVDIDESNPHGGSPLILAVQNGHLYTVKYLVRKGADLNKSSKAITPVIKALMSKEYEITQFLIDNGAYYGNGKDEYGPVGDPIRHAIKAPLELFEQILKESEIRQTDLRGYQQLLHSVAETGNLKKVKLLEAAGYDLNIRDFQGNTVVTKLKSNKQLEVLNYLKRKGVSE